MTPIDVRSDSQLRTLFIGLALGAWLLLSGLSSVAADSSSDSATLLHIIDYIAVDYAGAVAEGKVIDAAEYEEMREFAAHAARLAVTLPVRAGRDEIIVQSKLLSERVERRESAADIRRDAQALSRLIVASYDIAIVPRIVPSLSQGETTFKLYCVSCHGERGDGQGSSAQGLDPKPTDFRDRVRMNQRSVFSLYNTITLGVDRTAMPSFASLSDADRWSVALYLTSFSMDRAEVERGRQLMTSARLPRGVRLDELALALSSDEAHLRFGSNSQAVQTYLRTHPELLVQSVSESPLSTAITLLGQTRSAIQVGNRSEAYRLSVQAYLEGFELAESQLQAADKPLMLQIERDMLGLRQLIQGNDPSALVLERIDSLTKLLERARMLLQEQKLSPAATFTSALVILLREGIEALLVIAAILGFLKRSERRDAVPYVHFGWIAAVALGLVTWLLATYAISISGARREITEGVTALIAAAMLIYVGYWLHTRSAAGAWKKFIEQSASAALARKTLWAMSGLAFLAVYREMFETVLFYQALWSEAGGEGRVALLAGVGTGVIALGTIAVAVMKYGMRLPLGLFFTVTAGLLLALSVVMAGQGIRALQEAGAIASTEYDLPTISWLGLFPTAQGLATQAAAILLIALVLVLARRGARLR